MPRQLYEPTLDHAGAAERRLYEKQSNAGNAVLRVRGLDITAVAPMGESELGEAEGGRRILQPQWTTGEWAWHKLTDVIAGHKRFG